MKLQLQVKKEETQKKENELRYSKNEDMKI